MRCVSSSDDPSGAGMNLAFVRGLTLQCGGVGGSSSISCAIFSGVGFRGSVHHVEPREMIFPAGDLRFEAICQGMVLLYIHLE